MPPRDIQQQRPHRPPTVVVVIVMAALGLLPGIGLGPARLDAKTPMSTPNGLAEAT